MPQTVFSVDRAQSVIARYRGASASRARYAPFGYSSPRPSQGQSAFSGQWLTPAGEYYLLGNGRRGYGAARARFGQPDVLSPFGAGGLNSYAYCASEPVNRLDPTGQAFTPLVVGSLIGGLANTLVQAASLGSRSAKQTPRAMRLGLRLAALTGLTGVAASALAGAQPDNRPAQQGLTWAGIALGVTSVALRGAVLMPALYQAGLRRVAGRVFGLRRANATDTRSVEAVYEKRSSERLVAARP
jgi:RHS repeat-associated protein